MHRIAIAAAALLIAGTASARERPVDHSLDRIIATPVVCEGPEDCEAKWSRALSWVLTYADYRLQLNTDTLIQTYGPFINPHGTAFSVTKVPLGGGRYVFELRAACRSTPWCGRDLRERTATFVMLVMGADLMRPTAATQ